MDPKELNYFYNKFKFGEESFHYLMRNRIKEILLVSSFYDAFTFEQDGRLSEQIFGEYRQLNLSTAPRITSVPTAEEALKLVERKTFDLVITMLHVGKTSSSELAKQIKNKQKDLPVVLLLSTFSDTNYFEPVTEADQAFDGIYLWNGDAKLFLAIIKSIEDKRNVGYDTKKGLVRVILLVEDSIKYYSIFLPLLYQEIVKQTQILIREELNDINKRLRMRARPKVILAHTYEEAQEIYAQYREYIIAVISDIRYPKNGQLDDKAGIKLIRQIKQDEFDIPTILLSADLENKKQAELLHSTFLHKYSKRLLNNLNQFIHDHLGFGEFIFKDAQGNPIDKAKSLEEFKSKLESASNESIIYHSKRNHFSAWLMARGEIQIARKIRPLKVKDFSSIQAIRSYLISTLDKILNRRRRGNIINFHPLRGLESNQIMRLAEGSLGGKGRGLAFLNALLVTMELETHFGDSHILLPGTAIIGTNEYDHFIERNNIAEIDVEGKTDQEINTLFLKGKLSQSLVKKLKALLQKVNFPLAVRSSGLLEDSYSEPFAGIYRTFMLPNNDPDLGKRLNQLVQAIKLVYASVYTENARLYIESLNHQLDEEKMAVLIQKIAGKNHNDQHFYPHFSGVAQSYNFYPISKLKNEDGIVSLAVGLGRTIMEGDKVFRFCPTYPKKDFFQPETLLKDTQSQLYAIKLDNQNFDLTQGEKATLERIDIQKAEQHRVLKHLASTWDIHDKKLVAGVRGQGPRVINYANILRYQYFPLADIINKLLEIGEAALGMPVEMEFAVDLEKNISHGKYPTFYILQIRPLTIGTDEVVVPQELDWERVLLATDKGMGNGIFDHLKDIIYIDPDKFDKSQTQQMKKDISQINQEMDRQNCDYILIGPGRWGSQDRFLGIPVRFVDIHRARVIVEVGLEEYNIDPSQGTHFFHNVVAMKLGYFAVPYHSGSNYIDWDWIHTQEARERGHYFFHIRTNQALIVKMDGRSGRSVIFKPQ